MNNYICSECGTENEEKYAYCKNCGMPLKREKTEEKSDYDFSQSNEYEYSNNQTDSNTVHNTPKGIIVDNIDGIPQEEISLFIGKKSYDILPKFSKMEITGSKTSWCWPAAVLGFLFGPAGVALWFFYRKMYKPAVILSVIGAVVTFVTSFMMMGSSQIDFEAFFSSAMNNDLNAALEAISTTETMWTVIADGINNIISILACILGGLYGYYFYKEHCVNKINNFKMYHADQRYYRLGLASIGGVSGGMLAVGILIMVCVNNAASIVTAIISNI